jgi:hypothetical protein
LVVFSTMPTPGPPSTMPQAKVIVAAARSTSVHRSAHSCERRAPVVAASRRYTPKSGSSSSMRVSAPASAFGLATGLVIALFPAAAIGGGLLAAAAGGGALLGSLAGHAAAGMSRKDLKEAGEALDRGTAGLVLVGVSDMQAKIERAMAKAERVEAKQLKADTVEIEKDAKDS